MRVPRFRLHLVLLPLICLSIAAALASEQVSFSSQSSLVLVPVTVTDRNGKTVTGLQPEHFSITDNSAPREIISFGRTNTPIALGVVMDLSASMQRKLPWAVGAAQTVIRNLDPEDAGYLVTFDRVPQVRVGFTRETGTIAQNLLFPRAEGNTALYDAIHLGLQQGRQSKGMRRVLLVVSDGGDNRSRLMESELVAAAVEADTQIYCIAVHEPLRAKDEVAGSHFLGRLAQLTGGLYFDVRGTKEIPGVAETIARAMKEQYLLGFKPEDGSRPDQWRKLRVRVNAPDGSPVRVSARSSYYHP